MSEEKEMKIKKKREELLNFLKSEKITYANWETFIKSYIDQKYRESALL